MRGGGSTNLLTEVRLERRARGLELHGDGKRLQARAGRACEGADLLAEARAEARVEHAIRRHRDRRSSALIGAEGWSQNSEARPARVRCGCERVRRPREVEVLGGCGRASGARDEIAERA